MNKIAPSNILHANRVVDALTKFKIDVSTLTEEEQADLIIERLTNGHNEDLLEDAISYTLSALIAEEIDKEILQSLFSLKGPK